MGKILKHKKEIILILVGIAIMVALLIFVGGKIGTVNVKFESVNEKVIPRKISNEIIPEYRNLERALACIVDENIYVIVSRGEKPCAGYEVEVKKLEMERKNDKSNLKVYVNYADPEHGENMPQVVTYPVVVCKTQMKGLPDTIELIREYIK